MLKKYGTYGVKTVICSQERIHKMDKICVNIYGGSVLFCLNGEPPFDAETIYCDHADSCSFHANGKCLRVRRGGHQDCVYGRVETTRGYTSRNKAYPEWRQKIIEDSVYAKLKDVGWGGQFAVMGDYYYFETDYAHAEFDGDDLVIESSSADDNFFLEKNRCTPEVFVKILTFTPAGQEDSIRTYAKDIVPKLMQDIKELCPDLYAQIIALDPKLKGPFNLVGQKVYVNTITENSVITDNRGREFVFKDGNLICNAYNRTCENQLPFDAETGKLIIPVTDTMVCRVTDTSQTNENTRIAD